VLDDYQGVASLFKNGHELKDCECTAMSKVLEPAVYMAQEGRVAPINSIRPSKISGRSPLRCRATFLQQPWLATNHGGRHHRRTTPQRRKSRCKVKEIWHATCNRSYAVPHQPGLPEGRSLLAIDLESYRRALQMQAALNTLQVTHLGNHSGSGQERD
jgi:hypothetical protein